MEKVDKRCTIMRATLEIVAEQGFHGTPMALVAERSGVAAGTIYRYFESKDVLIAEIYHFLEERFLAVVMDGYPEGAPVRERFLHMGKALVKYCTSSPLEFRFLEQFHNSPYGIAHRREKFFGNKEKDVLFDLFTEAAKAGMVKDLPLPVLFALGFCPLLDISRDHILHFIELDAKLIDSCVEACWEAIRK
ncbi:TetR family transcriptional regulator [Geomonas sp. RF6]|uniref:TetR/AcrR family transcriptional regulator n=1 Tax=Geomonas sp. RF6 TaxID=2897342 RepID=UPI001E40DDCE|nr:TetR/AcrR family transcriptional regulator [Geomonas sp. RF6]UFS70184.1 TetR family transcriptional regulator [Geomonas sp. RF6]